MTKNALVKSLSLWAQAALPVGGEHCFETHPRFRIPGAGLVDLLTLRHLRPALVGQAEPFAVGLWSIHAGIIEDDAVDGMTRRLHAFEAWYSELLEHAEIQGFSSGHRIRVCGNLVGRSVRRSPLVDLLSTWGSALSFWTWREAAAGFDVAPYYGKSPALTSARGQLKGLLHHLPWQDTADRDLEAAAAKHPFRK